jgi:hypothetical protein
MTGRASVPHSRAGHEGLAVEDRSGIRHRQRT